MGQTSVPPDVSNVLAVAAGNFHSLALTADGRVVVWGDNSYGQRNVPAGLSNVVAIAAYGDQCLALKADGRVVGWGSPGTYPVITNSLTNIVAIAGRNGANLALTADGVVKMWAGATWLSVPPAITNVAAIAGGGIALGVALKTTGELATWGQWTGGRPATVPTNLANVIAIGAADSFSAALIADGTITCWGFNDCDGETNAPAAATNLAAIAVAHNHSLALRSDGTVVAWGCDRYGEARVPAGLTNVVAIAAGALHNLAIVGDGSPFITVHPLGQSVYEGTSATFNARAVGWPPMAYQWRCEANDVVGATTATLVVTNCLPAQTGNYAMRALNAWGVAVSRPATLNVMPGEIVVSSQPVSRTNNAGTTATFNVSVRGKPPLSYQWFKGDAGLSDSEAISGAQTPTLTLRNVIFADGGEYSVRITNAFGSVTSQVATLSVVDPAINSDPYGGSVLAGDPVTLCVVAGGTPPLSYQWLYEGVLLSDAPGISGAQSDCLWLTNVLHANAGGYSVIVSNIYGSVTSQVTVLSVTDPAILQQPADQRVNGNGPATLSVVAGGTPPLTYQWRKNGQDVPGATDATLTWTNIQGTDGGLYDVLVTSAWGSLRSLQAYLSVNMALPDSFNPAPDGPINIVAPQADGKILVSGSLTSIAGHAATYLARLNADGSFDAQFLPHLDYLPQFVGLQPNGQIVVADTLGNVFRLNSNGTRDASFNSDVTAPMGVTSGALLPDGRILLAGVFSSTDGQWSDGLMRLQANGTLDRTFHPQFDIQPQCVAVQPDGRIVIGGWFGIIAGQNQPFLARLYSNGSRDATFSPLVDYAVSRLIVQPDGRILVAGFFSFLGGQPRNGLGRLYTGGALDSAFNPSVNFVSGSEAATSIALQTDGGIILGSWLTGVTGPNLGRLNANGSVDTTFDPGWGFEEVSTIAVQPDGKVLLGGAFTNIAGQPRAYLARLNNTAPATQSLTFDGSQVTWLRGGTSPEVWRTTFEYSTNYTDWTSLGAGARINGGWRIAAAGLPPNAGVRARGFVGAVKASWFVETILAPRTPPSIVTDDNSFGIRSGRFGFNLVGVAGQTVVIEASPDLAGWTPLATNTLGPGPWYFSDEAWTNSRSRFYRARLQ